MKSIEIVWFQIAYHKKCEFDLEYKPCNTRLNEFGIDDFQAHLDDDPTQSILELAKTTWH